MFISNAAANAHQDTQQQGARGRRAAAGPAVHVPRLDVSHAPGLVPRHQLRLPSEGDLAGRGRERQGRALRRRDGGLSLQVPQPPPRPPAREVPAQHEAGHLRVGAQGRGHPLHTSVARNRQRGQVQRQEVQLVFEGIVLYLVQERRQSARTENVFS